LLWLWEQLEQLEVTSSIGISRELISIFNIDCIFLRMAELFLASLKNSSETS
jgi:hypothetical protein